MTQARRCGYQRGLVSAAKSGVDPWGNLFADRILYRGNQLDLSVYSRSELRGSDHKPGLPGF
jgi:hypothetical protein